VISGGRDRLIDPATKDYVRTADGKWEEVADSRTTVLIAFSTELGGSIFDPSHGTVIAQRIREGTLNSVDILQAEAQRVGADLEEAGFISDLAVRVRDEEGQPLADEQGRAVVHLTWNDVAAGVSINATFTPR
jgi:hypothetical protein